MNAVKVAHNSLLSFVIYYLGPTVLLSRLHLKMNPYLKHCLPYLKKSLATVPFLRSHPYSWPADSIHPLEIKSCWVGAHCYFNFTLFVVYVAFVIWRAGEICFDAAETFHRQFYMTFISLVCAIQVNIYFTAMKTRNGLLPFFRTYIRFVEYGKNCLLLLLKLQPKK